MNNNYLGIKKEKVILSEKQMLDIENDRIEVVDSYKKDPVILYEHLSKQKWETLSSELEKTKKALYDYIYFIINDVNTLRKVFMYTLIIIFILIIVSQIA